MNGLSLSLLLFFKNLIRLKILYYEGSETELKYMTTIQMIREWIYYIILKLYINNTF